MVGEMSRRLPPGRRMRWARWAPTDAASGDTRMKGTGVVWCMGGGRGPPVAGSMSIFGVAVVGRYEPGGSALFYGCVDAG